MTTHIGLTRLRIDRSAAAFEQRSSLPSFVTQKAPLVPIPFPSSRGRFTIAT